MRHRSELPADRGGDRSRRPDRRRRSDRRDARPGPGSDGDERLEQYQPRANRRGRLRLPNRGRRDPVHVRPVAGARVRRGHRPRRWVALDLKVPDTTPGRLVQLGTAIVRPFASIDEWIMRRPWEAIRVAMQEELADLSWTELFFGTAFLAAGSRGPGTSGRRPGGSSHQCPWDFPRHQRHDRGARPQRVRWFEP